MLEHYVRAAKALDIDIDKIYEDMARALVREELTRKERKKMRKEMKQNKEMK
jgi:Arc/MetJ family transcription regulator